MSFKMAKDLVIEFQAREVTRLSRQYMDLLDSPHPSVRLQGINGLKKTGTWTEYALKLAEDSNFGVRKALAEYIKETGTQDQQPVIEQLLMDPDDRVRLSALNALYAINPEPERLRVLLQDPSPKIRVRVLKLAASELPPEDVQPLLEDRHVSVRAEAYQAFIERTEDPVALEKIAQETPFPQARKSALLKLLVFRPDFVQKFFSEMLSSDRYTEQEKKVALTTLKHLPYDAIASILRQAFDDPRLRAHYPVLIPLYVEINLDSPATAISFLTAWLEAEEPKIRLSAVKGFGKLAEPATVTLLRERLQDSDETVRAAAVDALARLMDYELEKVVGDLLQDHSYLVRKAAIKAISRLKLVDEYANFVERMNEKKEETRLRVACIEHSAKARYGFAIESPKRIMGDLSEASLIRSAAAYALLRLSPAAVIELLSQ